MTMLYLVLTLLTFGFLAFLLGRRSQSMPATAPRTEAPPEQGPAVSRDALLARIDPGHHSDLDQRVTQPLPELPVVDPALVTASTERGFSGTAQLRALLDKDPDNVDMLSLLGYHYYNERNLDEALELYERALQLRPADPVLNLYAGNTLYLKGRVENARDRWTKVTQIDRGGKLAQKAQDRLARARSTSDAKLAKEGQT